MGVLIFHLQRKVHKDHLELSSRTFSVHFPHQLDIVADHFCLHHRTWPLDGTQLTGSRAEIQTKVFRILLHRSVSFRILFQLCYKAGGSTGQFGNPRLIWWHVFGLWDATGAPGRKPTGRRCERHAERGRLDPGHVVLRRKLNKR